MLTKANSTVFGIGFVFESNTVAATIPATKIPTTFITPNKIAKGTAKSSIKDLFLVKKYIIAKALTIFDINIPILKIIAAIPNNSPACVFIFPVASFDFSNATFINNTATPIAIIIALMAAAAPRTFQTPIIFAVTDNTTAKMPRAVTNAVRVLIKLMKKYIDAASLKLSTTPAFPFFPLIKKESPTIVPIIPAIIIPAATNSPALISKIRIKNGIPISNPAIIATDLTKSCNVSTRLSKGLCILNPKNSVLTPINKTPIRAIAGRSLRTVPVT